MHADCCHIAIAADDFNLDQQQSFGFVSKARLIDKAIGMRLYPPPAIRIMVLHSSKKGDPIQEPTFTRIKCSLVRTWSFLFPISELASGSQAYSTILLHHQRKR